MIEALRDHLRLNAGFNGNPALLCVTGAESRTSAIAAIADVIDARLLPRLAFDALGVPTDDEMTRCWDAPRAWQKMMTYHWVHTARHIFRMRPLVLLEGQFDPQYAIAACASHRVKNHVVLVDSGEHPEWAENARSLGGTIIDGHGSPATTAAAICAAALELMAQ